MRWKKVSSIFLPFFFRGKIRMMEAFYTRLSLKSILSIYGLDTELIGIHRHEDSKGQDILFHHTRLFLIHLSSSPN